MLGVRATKAESLDDYPVQQHRFNPYSNNHGTVAAIAGSDYVVMASDGRLSAGYTILTREQSKLFPLTKSCILGSTGCWADVLTFTKVVEARRKIYVNTHGVNMGLDSFAQMISTMLYAKRFFPYYVSNILGGLDDNGEGFLYTYDPVGNIEKCKYRAGGASVSLIQPMLDNQVGKKNIQNADASQQMTLQEAINLVHDVFVSAAEREIHTGDSILFKVITKDGIQEFSQPLPRH